MPLEHDVKLIYAASTGATSVFSFSHVIRRDPLSTALTIPKEVDDAEVVKISTPAWFAHVDQSYDGAWIALDSISKRDPSPDAKFLPLMARNRWAIINVWRPIKPINREPLAVCDARTVRESDLVEAILRPPRDAYANDPKGGSKPAGRHSGYMNYKTGNDEVDRAPDQKFWQLLPNARHKW